MTSVFLTEQALAGNGFPLPTSCEDCDILEQLFLEQCSANDINPQFISPFCEDLFDVLQTCKPTFCRAIGGDMIQMETTSILAAGAQYTAAWMIPVIIAVIGIGIFIARKF